MRKDRREKEEKRELELQGSDLITHCSDRDVRGARQV